MHREDMNGLVTILDYTKTVLAYLLYFFTFCLLELNLIIFEFTGELKTPVAKSRGNKCSGASA